MKNPIDDDKNIESICIQKKEGKYCLKFSNITFFFNLFPSLVACRVQARKTVTYGSQKNVQN